MTFPLNFPPPSTHHYLIHNACIYSGLEPYNTWMVFDQKTGLIQSIGVSDPPTDHFKPEKTADCNGSLVLPGLHDSHLHMLMYGEQLSQLDLKGCKSIGEMKERISHFRKNNPSAKLISGYGWEQDLLGRYPLATDIDDVCRDVPVLLKRACFHVAVANQKLLDLAGISESHPNMLEIERHPPTHPKLAGKPTGILKENILTELSKLKPAETKEERLGYLTKAIGELLKAGVTSAHPCEKDTWSEFCHLLDNQQLPIRIFYCTYGLPQNSSTGNSRSNNSQVGNSDSINTQPELAKIASEQTDSFPESHDASRGSMLFCCRVKFFADGALGPMTAALSHPYPKQLGDHSNGDSNHDNRCLHRNKGILLLTEEELEESLTEIAIKRGYRVEVHVIGDRAAEMVLEVMERVGVDPAKRPVFIHCQILRLDLIQRMKSRGIVAIVQPQFVNTDGRWLNDCLPQVLHEHAYVWKTLLDAGIRVAGSSDAPIEEPRPLLGVFDAVFRLVGSRDVRNNNNVFKPEECLSIHQAIDLYTKTAAFAAGKESELGQLLPGFQADFVLIDRDIVADPHLAATAVVMETWVAGVRRWALGDE